MDQKLAPAFGLCSCIGCEHAVSSLSKWHLRNLQCWHYPLLLPTNMWKVSLPPHKFNWIRRLVFMSSALQSAGEAREFFSHAFKGLDVISLCCIISSVQPAVVTHSLQNRRTLTMWLGGEAASSCPLESPWRLKRKCKKPSQPKEAIISTVLNLILTGEDVRLHSRLVAFIQNLKVM